MNNTNRHNGTALYCDCHDRKLMAVLKPHEGLEIRDDGHMTSVPAQELLRRLSGTTTGDGVVNYVRTLMGG